MNPCKPSPVLENALSVENLNIVLLALKAIAVTAYLLVGTALVYSFIPIPQSPDNVFLDNVKEYVKPEREMFFYRLFVIVSLGIYFVMLTLCKRRFDDRKFLDGLQKSLLADGVLLFLLGFALFKMMVWGPSTLVNVLFGLSLILALGVNVFWPGIVRLLDAVGGWLQEDGSRKVIQRGLDVLVPVFIALAILTPDPTLVKERIFGPDKFTHFSSFIMGPGWAFLKGLSLNVDVWSLYGNGEPAVIAGLAQLLGKFSYENVIVVMTAMIAAYFIGCYAFLRLWLKDALPAALGVFLAIRLQMFPHKPAEFLVLTAPSSTVIRYFFDIVLLACLLMHARTQHKRWLWTAGGTAGFSLYYITDTGVYQLVAYYAYIILTIFFVHTRPILFRSVRDAMWPAIYIVAPLCSALLFLGMTIGHNVASAQFWFNMREFLGETQGGLGALPFYFSLQNHLYPEFWGSLVMPLTYLATLLILTGMGMMKRGGQENIFVMALSVYGLCLLHYHICRSAPVNYLTVGIPFVFLVCFWVDKILFCVRENNRRPILLLLTLGAFFGLMTTHSFLFYPNVLGLSKFSRAESRRIAQYKEDFQNEAILPQDVDLIRRFSAAGDPVCLISAYETDLLMAADRKPFFYFFPMMFPFDMRKMDYNGLNLCTHRRLARTLRQMTEEKPPLVFVEWKLFPLNERFPDVALTQMLGYIGEHYEVAGKGKFLVAMKPRTASSMQRRRQKGSVQ